MMRELESLYLVLASFMSLILFYSAMQGDSFYDLKIFDRLI